MPAHRYMEEIGSVAMLATKRLAGVAPKVNLREHESHNMYASTKCEIRMPTLALKPRGDVTRSPKRGLSVAPQKGLMSFKFFLKKSIA